MKDKALQSERSIAWGEVGQTDIKQTLSTLEYSLVSDVPYAASDLRKNFRLLRKGRWGGYEHINHPHSFQPCSS